MAAAATAQVCWQPTAPQPSDLLAQVLVGHIVGQCGTVVCPADATLADAADLLITHDHTAAGVVDESGAVLGAITENDILQAYAEGVHPLSGVTAWLQSGHARMPRSALQDHVVRPETPLLHAAALMRASKAQHEDVAFRHLVVLSQAGAFVGILSALDVARALRNFGNQNAVLHRLADQVINEVMKPLAALPAVLSTAPLGECLARMIYVHQNCVMVMDGICSVPDGVITPRDALRAFADHVPLDTEVGRWLRGIESDWESRAVLANTTVAQVAALMSTSKVHHLVVLAPTEATEVVGVVSSSDLAQIVGLAEFMRA